MAPSRPDTANQETPNRKAPGEFTRLFSAPALPDDSRPTATLVSVDPNAPTAEIPALPQQEAASPAAEKPSKAPARDSFAEFFGVPPQPPAGNPIETKPPAAGDASIAPKEEASAAQGQHSPGQFTQQCENLNLSRATREMTSPATEPLRPAKAPEVPRASGQDAPSSPAGAFTKLFGAPAQPSTQETPAMPPASPAQPPGEFTRMFRFNSQPPPPPATPQPEAKAEGAFANAFRAGPVAPSPPQYPPAPPEAKEAGAFTKLFNMPPPEEPLTARPAAALPQPARDPLAALQPSEVPGNTPAATQIFVRPGGNVSPEPPPVAAGPSAFTKIISAPAAAPPAPVPAAPAPSPPAPPPPGMAPFFAPPAVAIPPVSVPPPQVAPMPWPMPPVQVAAMPPQPQIPPSPQPQSAPPAPSVNWMPLILGINVFLLLAIIVILIFALRK